MHDTRQLPHPDKRPQAGNDPAPAVAQGPRFAPHVDAVVMGRANEASRFIASRLGLPLVV